MRNEIQPLSYMVKHDPAAFAGWVLIGSSSVLYIHVELKMVKAGYKTSFAVLRGPLSSQGAIPAFTRYLRVCGEHCWSPWPVYLFLPCLGISLEESASRSLRHPPCETSQSDHPRDHSAQLRVSGPKTRSNRKRHPSSSAQTRASTSSRHRSCDKSSQAPSPH